MRAKIAAATLDHIAILNFCRVQVAAVAAMLVDRIELFPPMSWTWNFFCKRIGAYAKYLEKLKRRSERVERHVKKYLQKLQLQIQYAKLKLIPFY